MHLAFFKAASWRVISLVSVLLTSLYALWLYTAYIAPARYGVMALALTIMAYLPYLDGGFRTVITRAVLATGKPEERADLLEFGQRLYTILSLGIIVLGLMAMSIYAQMPGTRAENISLSFLLLFGLANTLIVCANIQWAVLVSAQEQSKFYILQTLGAWISVNVLAWSFRSGYELWSIPFATLGSFVVTYPLSLRWLKHTFPKLRIFDLATGEKFWNQFQRLKSEAWFCFRSQVTTLILYSADIFIIGYFSPKPEVAVYYIIIRLVSMTRSILQTGGEVGWPFLAQRGVASRADAVPWFATHGWIYGSVTGAMAVVAIPFCVWYMGPTWTVSPLLLWVILLRFLIVGLGSSATYLLYAVGEFRPITRSLEAELIAGLILGTVGGYVAGSLGVATGFLLATAGGTLVPVYIAYSRHSQVPFWLTYTTIWSRAILGFTASYLTAQLLIQTLTEGIHTPLIASAAITVSLLLAIILALARSGFSIRFDARQLLQLLRKI